ncbi:hypothetical protein B0H67DRAFT_544563 [Lasiosphaeris hirsuta]|uniref:Uncharacterized protein n=1 Tax=Lasiosphaeris hirsuta TaxID=260670 RepID=A0AA40DPH6_9PEZI|nr:hypothetical protein B0H67DRAFT_544563 [Lasiosphaeris hirsuta]
MTQMDKALEDVISELDDQANRVVALVVKLIRLLSVDLRELLKDEISKQWECDYKCRDLGEQVAWLKKQLRESISLASLEHPTPTKVKSALETAQENRIKELEILFRDAKGRIMELETRIRELDGRLIHVLSHNWELAYKCRDLSGDIWRYKGQLRVSIALGDLEAPPLKPKTALERALEKKIDELEESNRHPQRRTRSKSI